MKSNIFIPKKINVGFQKRNSTYTGKLAYIIYFDEKGKLRKENSWNSWRDKKIENIIHDNVPTSGFVLNKKVGDYVSDWNHRQAYVRVYDPRDFEFEITIENLLYILENTSSIKGKGLEGDFIYGWDGKDLILIPTESPDYIELSELNNLRHEKKKFNGKDLIIGGTYKSNDNNELIYLGRYYESNYNNKETKSYFFYNRESKYSNIVNYKSLTGNIIDVIDENCVEDYSMLMDELLKCSSYSSREPKYDVYVDYAFSEFNEIVIKHGYYGEKYYILNDNNEYIKYIVKENRDSYYSYFHSKNNTTYDVYTTSKGHQNERIIEKDSLENIFNQIKPKYLVTYNVKKELIKEWK